MFVFREEGASGCSIIVLTLYIEILVSVHHIMRKLIVFVIQVILHFSHLASHKEI